MLSHLRLHRRAGASNPTSPSPDQQQSSASPLSGHQSPFALDSASPQDSASPSSGASALPPTLPPITRVTSADNTHLDLRRDGDSSLPDTRPQQAQRSPYHGSTGFIGGVALENYRRDIRAQQTSAAPDVVDPSAASHVDEDSTRQYARSPAFAESNTNLATAPAKQIESKPSFTTPTELQNSTSSSGRWTAANRLPEAPPMATTPATNPITVEPTKGRKGLPFLKNPMSTLLLRRKNNQPAPESLPLPLNTQLDEPTYDPTYDPRIKGTRVHDFSAPRRRNKAKRETGFGQPASHTDAAVNPDKSVSPAVENRDSSLLDVHPTRQTSATSHSAVSDSPSVYSQQPPASPADVDERGTAPADNDTTPGENAPPPVPEKDVSRGAHEQNITAPRVPTSGSAGFSQVSTSTQDNRSRNVSISSVYSRDMMSSIPRHMKSTSSRFSFDMSGAAKQEKILEERHRQREMEKKTAEEAEPEPRDSRFDDFDEDSFDYDAMMDDDGLEERIPGVNADFDDDDGFPIEDNFPLEDDFPVEEDIPVTGDFVVEEDVPNVEEFPVEDEHHPDNDQENFAGFVFQRSNPTSSLATPQTAAFAGTPRDADGTAIGFAMTKDLTPNSQNFPLSPESGSAPLSANKESQPPGLGIQEVETADSEAVDDVSSLPPPGEPNVADVPRTTRDDDMYYDDGLLGTETEFAEDLAYEPEYDTSAPFDESIFDMNDTDEFGRPLPGAFAHAQSMRQATQSMNQGSVKRESDLTSGLSQHSEISRSTTAHTSLSADTRRDGPDKVKKSIEQAAVDEPQPHTLPSSAPIRGSTEAYQAALAAAAHNAEASGKFRRGSTTSQDDELAVDGRLLDSVYEDDNLGHSGYVDDSYDDMYDFELDDDAIIAEANASALAYDSDGWYGQEFGFYSAPIHQHGGSRSSSVDDSADFGYANGGFFGPKGASGLDRSTSGRVVSREPNLTPITERSEYSNRNSLMSMGIPLSAGTPTLQSPGLAQLAMMGGGDDQMTISALLRLRSKAWGGSQISLSSSREGSPQSERGEGPSASSWNPQTQHFRNPPGMPPNVHARKNSTFSNVSRDSEPSSPPGSPTLTMDMAAFSSPPPQQPIAGYPVRSSSMDGPSMPTSASHPDLQRLQTGFLPAATNLTESPLSASSPASAVDLPSSAGSMPPPPLPPPRRPGKGHRRQKSSTDSISYTMEEDSGETRWIMERRRTGESGKVEVLEREVLDNLHI